MAFFQRIRTRIAAAIAGKKSFSEILALLIGEPEFIRANFKVLSTEAYGQNVYANASINLISQAVANIPWLAFKQDRAGELTELPGHPIIELLDHPNPFNGRATFFVQHMSYYHIAGKSYVHAVRPDDNGPPKELWVLRPDLVKIEKGTAANPIAGVRFGEAGKQQPLRVEDIWYLRTFNPLDPLDGLSPLSVAARSITQNNESQKWNVALLQNSARPSGAFVAKGNLGDDTYNRLKSEVHQKHTGPTNSKLPLVLSGGVEWKEMSLSPSDMDFLEGQKLSAREIALTLGVPPELIGDSSNKTFSNYKEARKSFYEETVLPLMELLATELNRWLVPMYKQEGLFVTFDTDQVAALQEDRDKLFERVEKASFLEVNEKRDLTGFEAKEGGDVILVPINLVPMGGGSIDGGDEDGEEDDRPGRAARRKKKAFNLPSDEAKAIHWKIIDRRRQAWEQRAIPLFQRRLGGDIADAARAFEQAPTVDEARLAALSAVTINEEKWRTLYRRLYMNIGIDFAAVIFAGLKAALPVIQTKQNGDDRNDFISIVQDAINGWLTNIAPLRIQGITQETNRTILSTIAAGVDAGESIPKIVRRIRATMGPDAINRNRATRIARTEVISASNLGSQAAARSTGLPIEKEWLATRDARLRHSHSVLDGQRVPLEDPYTDPTSGDKLMYPGDASLGASAGNVINCRCTEVYHTVGED